jgi:hypothetical protein
MLPESRSASAADAYRIRLIRVIPARSATHSVAGSRVIRGGLSKAGGLNPK